MTASITAGTGVEVAEVAEIILNVRHYPEDKRYKVGHWSGYSHDSLNTHSVLDTSGDLENVAKIAKMIDSKDTAVLVTW